MSCKVVQLSLVVDGVEVSAMTLDPEFDDSEEGFMLATGDALASQVQGIYEEGLRISLKLSIFPFLSSCFLGGTKDERITLAYVDEDTNNVVVSVDVSTDEFPRLLDMIRATMITGTTVIPPDVSKATFRFYSHLDRLMSDLIALFAEYTFKDAGYIGMSSPPVDTLKDAREHFHDNLEKGSICPCCDRFGKLYSGIFNKRQLETLYWIYYWHIRTGELVIASSGIPTFPKGCLNYVEVQARAPEMIVRNAETGKLATRGLLEKVSDNEHHKASKSSGMYRISMHGIYFLLGRSTTPVKVGTYNQKVEKISEDYVDINELKKSIKSFDYKTMMNEYFSEFVEEG